MSPKNPRVAEPPTLDTAAEERRQASLRELSAEWDRGLKECFNHPDFGKHVDAVFEARGRRKKRPIAGST
jgi:hypothetical protein